MNENKVKKIRVLSEYGRSDNRRGFTIYIFNPCFRIILAWDEYVTDNNSCVSDPARMGIYSRD